jgi:hypothetical protein
MPKSTRVTCLACGAQLGAILHDRLTVQGHQVQYGPKGALTITCTSCKAPRAWTARRSA